MGVEFKFPWRLIDKSGGVVAEGMSPYSDNAGDWVLQDDNTWLNYETGERASGNIKYLDRDGNIVEADPDDVGGGRGSSGGNSGGRAFGEIRTSTGSGVSPAFEQANHNDKPKVENPENPQPDTPTPPPNNGGSGGGLIGEIAKQNDILNRLVSKIGQTTGLSKISRGLGSLERAFKSSLENVSKTIKESANTVALNSGSNKVSVALKGVNENLAKIAEIKGDIVKISENGKGMLEIEKDRHTFEKTAQNIKDLDGQVVASISPREVQAVNNATQAKKNTDINNFELLESDIEDLFGDLPDPSGLFAFPMPYEVDKSFIGGS